MLIGIPPALSPSRRGPAAGRPGRSRPPTPRRRSSPTAPPWDRRPGSAAAVDRGAERRVAKPCREAQPARGAAASAGRRRGRVEGCGCTATPVPITRWSAPIGLMGQRSASPRRARTRRTPSGRRRRAAAARDLALEVDQAGEVASPACRSPVSMTGSRLARTTSQPAVVVAHRELGVVDVDVAHVDEQREVLLAGEDLLQHRLGDREVDALVDVAVGRCRRCGVGADALLDDGGRRRQLALALGDDDEGEPRVGVVGGSSRPSGCAPTAACGA